MSPDNYTYMGTCSTGYSTDAWWKKGRFFDKYTGKYLYDKNDKGERYIVAVYESELRK